MKLTKLLSSFALCIVLGLQTVSAVDLDFMTNDTVICENAIVTIINTTPNKEQYSATYDFLWEMPDGSIGRPVDIFVTDFNKASYGNGMVTMKLIEKSTNKVAFSVTKNLNIKFHERPTVTITSSHEKNGRLTVCRGVNFSLEATVAEQIAIQQYVWQIGITPPQLGKSILMLSDAIGTTNNADLTLTLEDEFGCSHLYTKPGYVTVKNESAINPTIEINTPITPWTKSFIRVCNSETNYNARFIAPIGSTATIESFVWTLPDGTQNSSDKILSGTLSGYGSKRFILKVIDSRGCESSNTFASIDMMDFQNTLDFRATNNDSKNEVDLTKINCYGDYFFTPTLKPLDSVSWDLNLDGKFTKEEDAGIAKTYSVNTEITMFGQIKGEGCSATVTKKLQIEPKAAITMDVEPKFACETKEFTYTVTSNLTEYTAAYKFESIDTTFPGNIFKATYGPGIHNVTLIPSTPAGCKIAPNTVTVEVAVPTGSIYLNQSPNHCVPHTVNYTDTVKYKPTMFKDSIVLYEWDFDNDGTTDYSAKDSAKAAIPFIYQNEGVYTSVFTITTANGCKYSAKDSTEVGTKQKIAYELRDTNQCALGKVYYKDLSSDAAKIDKIIVGAYANGYPWGPSKEIASPTYEQEVLLSDFDTVGAHGLNVKAIYNRCTTEVSYPNKIAIKGALVSANVIKNCSYTWDSASFFVRKKLQAADTVKWTIFKTNDKWQTTSLLHTQGAKITDTIPFSFKKFGPGYYAAAVEAYNDTCCNHSDTVRVIIENLLVNIDLWKSNLCLDNPEIKISHDELYGWTGMQRVTNKTLSISGPAYTPEKTYTVDYTKKYAVDSLMFNKQGKYRMILMSKDMYGCAKYDTAYMHVYKPVAAFETKDTTGCLPVEVSYKNLTTGDTTLANFYWSTNSDDSQTGITSSVSELFKAKYSTKDPIKTALIVETIAINKAGETCKDTLELSGAVKPIIPKLGIEYKDKICLGTSLEISRKNNEELASVEWKFDETDTWKSDFSEKITHTYTKSGDYKLSLQIKQKPEDGGCVNDTVINIEVRDFNPKIKLTEPDNKCFIKAEWKVQPEVISTVKGVTYNLYKDGKLFTDYTSFPAQYEFKTKPGHHTAVLEMLTPYIGCTRMADTVTMDALGAKIAFEILDDDSTVCVGEKFKARVLDTTNLKLTGFTWVFGNGSTNTIDTVVEITYDTVPASGMYKLSLSQGVSCAGYIVENGQVVGKLEAKDSVMVKLHRIESRFLQNGTNLPIAGCPPFGVAFTNESFGQNELWWDFGNGQTTSQLQPDSVYYQNSGTYTASLRVRNDKCDHTIKKTVTVYPNPEVTWSAQQKINCEGNDATILANAKETYTYQWNPAGLLNNAGRVDPTFLSADSTRTFHVTATNTYNCSIKDSVKLTVQNRPHYTGAPKDSISYLRLGEYVKFRPTDTLVVLEKYDLGNDSLANVKYKWTPSTYLTCDTCANPLIAIPDGVEKLHYKVQMTDIYGCFDESAELDFTVIKNTMAALPGAFTPNGDGSNDILYLRGWAIRQLVELRVYNRLGQLVFETDDINKGWDGTFNGKDQPADTYAYTFKIITFAGEEKFSKGDFKLVR